MKPNLALVVTAFLGLMACFPTVSLGDPARLEERKSELVDIGKGYSNRKASAGTIHVRPGESIQHAIDVASPGDRIIVKAGTYCEQLLIKKDGISLVGHGAVLMPPGHAVENKCSGFAGPGTQAGICVFGSDVDLGVFEVEHRKVLSVGDPVKRVSITGFHVRDFSGANIAVVGALDTRVTENKLTGGRRYGFVTAGSTNTRVSDNDVSARKIRFIGICVDDFAGARVSDNSVSGYNVALCIQTNGAEVRDNEARANCIGVFVDPAIDGAKIRDNLIGASNPDCATEVPAAEAFGVFGIFLDSALNTKVQGNVVKGQKNDGSAAGIAIMDDPCIERSLACITLGNAAPAASGNVVVENILRRNDVDLTVKTKGSNVVKRNECSTPKELCH